MMICHEANSYPISTIEKINTPKYHTHTAKQTPKLLTTGILIYILLKIFMYFKNQHNN